MGISRAYELLDNDTKTQIKYLQTLQKELKKQKDDFEYNLMKLQSDKLKDFMLGLQEKEDILDNILNKMKKDSSSYGDNKEIIIKGWDDIKILKKDIIKHTIQQEQKQNNKQQKTTSITSYIP